jgi:DNA-binding PadR family transcriptional regulator
MRRTKTTLSVAQELISNPTRGRWSYELAQTLSVKMEKTVYRGAIRKVLLRMRDLGWLVDYWDTSSGPVRRYYRLTETGKLRIAEFVEGCNGNGGDDDESSAVDETPVVAAVG